jgi:NosR/NirI family nitrous oxide reductase transcriptional regulator
MAVKRAYRLFFRALLGGSLLLAVLLFDRGNELTVPVLEGLGIPVAEVSAASKDHTSLRLLKEMVPGADSFSEKGGEPPVYRAYRTEANGEQTLIGYAFVTPDVPPEPNGYNGPIDTLIGIDLEGRIVGLKAIYYKESLRYTLGDFLSFKRYREQFIGKTAADPFSVNNDIDGIANATISVKAMASGVRRALREVTEAYIK